MASQHETRLNRIARAIDPPKQAGVIVVRSEEELKNARRLHAGRRIIFDDIPVMNGADAVREVFGGGRT